MLLLATLISTPWMTRLGTEPICNAPTTSDDCSGAVTAAGALVAAGLFWATAGAAAAFGALVAAGLFWPNTGATARKAPAIAIDRMMPGLRMK